ncbi:hypothetical protein [Microbacterium panaciterrae]|uniref:Uncharacterized protein n=1 Tax=Microbacterium panaciterrae TaxID=985759 RepID=A0ABP8PFF5_9MICO
MPRARPLPSSLGDSFTFAEGTAAGATPKQLRRAEFAAPFRAARMRPSPDEDEKADQDEDPFRDPLVDIVRSLSTAYALVMPPDAHLSHSTAAAHHGLPLPRHAFALHEDPLLAISDRVFVEAAVHGPGRAPRGGRIRGHETVAAQDPVMRVAGIPMSTPAATWGSLAARLSIEELVSVGDAAVQVPRIPGPFGRVLRAPLATFEDLDAVIPCGAPRRDREAPRGPHADPGRIRLAEGDGTAAGADERHRPSGPRPGPRRVR